MLKSKRERLIEVAIDLFYKYGFLAVGIERIYSEAGTTKTTLYKYFESKDDLARVAVENQEKWWRETFQRKIRQLGGDDPVACLEAIFKLLSSGYATCEFNSSLFINAACAYPDVNHQVHVGAKKNSDSILTMIKHHAKRAGILQIENFAKQLLLIINGTIVLEIIDSTGSATVTGSRLADILITTSLSENLRSKSVIHSKIVAISE